jgi:hypothetical protein
MTFIKFINNSENEKKQFCYFLSKYDILVNSNNQETICKNEKNLKIDNSKKILCWGDNYTMSFEDFYYKNNKNIHEKVNKKGLNSNEIFKNYTNGLSDNPDKSNITNIGLHILVEGKTYYGISLTLQNLNFVINHLNKPNEIVITSNSPPTLKIDYPLTNSYQEKLDSCTYTLVEIASIICLTYQKIYKEEKESTQLPVESIASRTNGSSGLINRARTNGKYGIYGHCLDDLLLHTIIYDKEMNLITLGVDS